MPLLHVSRGIVGGVCTLVLGILLVTPAEGAEPPKLQPASVLAVQKAEEDGAVYFIVAIERPEDMKVPKQRSSTGFFGPPPSLPAPPAQAELYGSPAWQYPCYAGSEADDVADKFPASTLFFVGRCPKQDSADLILRYRAGRTKWKQCSVKLDLKAAAPHADPPGLKSRWAGAQVSWFSQYRQAVGDVGGFLTYAEQQTRRRFGLEEAPEAGRDFARPRPTEGQEVLFDVTTGAMAVQESLQLDRMRNPSSHGEERTVKFEEIEPVKIKSHPFDEMRGDKEPAGSELAGLVPADSYYLRFNDLNKLRELLDFANGWGPSLLQLAEPVGADYDIDTRIRTQLCLPDTILSRLLGPAVIKELAVTGSDPYLREGSDVTILFDVRSRELFQKAVDIHFREAAGKHADAVQGSETYRDIAVERLVNPRRTISCFRCWVGDVCVYGNSFAAVKRIIDVGAKERLGLADAPDFKYMRAVVFPLDRATEDGFLYLSDAFIRRLVGPELRIKEKRRLEAVTSLKMLHNAALYHGFEHGPGRPGFDDFVAAGSLRASDLYDPDGGTFSWDSDLRLARSSKYGDLGFLTPLVEIDAGSATPAEKKQYKQFRERYESYWRDYFDPIGVRIKVDRTIQLELHILPLIELSTYTELREIAGGEPIPVDLGKFTDETLLRLVVHLKEGERKRSYTSFFSGMAPNVHIGFDWIGDWYTFSIEDSESFLGLFKAYYQGGSASREDDEIRRRAYDIFKANFAIGVHVKNPMDLVGFLMTLPAWINMVAPDMVLFRQLDPYQGVRIVQIAANPASSWFRAEQPRGGKSRRSAAAPDPQPTSPPASQPAVDPDLPAVYYAAIGDGFYVSTQAGALRRLIDRIQPAETAMTRPPELIRANLVCYVAPGAAQLSRPALQYWLEQQALPLSLRNTAQVYLLGRCGALDDRPLDDAAGAHLGYRLICPDGGTYRYDRETDSAACSVHGSLYSSPRLSAPPEGSPLGKLLDSVDRLLAYLRFTKEGLHTTLEIRRK